MTEAAAPEVGRPLPGADKAWVADTKWDGYVLAEDGHGPHWRSVFHVDESQSSALWHALVDLASDALVTSIHESEHGTTCGLRIELTFNDRTAPVVVAFHYADRGDRPRLVSAYPVP